MSDRLGNLLYRIGCGLSAISVAIADIDRIFGGEWLCLE
jgi:hypothetical protein